MMSTLPQQKKELHNSEHHTLVEEMKTTEKPKLNRYEGYRRSVYYFLERPGTTKAISYHLVNLILIVGSIIISVLSTIKSYETNEHLLNLILYYELALLSWFTLEYFLRLWSCSFLGKYRGVFGRFQFMRTLYMMIDAFVIISTLTTAILSVKTAYFSILRITRFLQIFRILRLDRQRGDLRTIGRVVYKHRKELVTCYFVGFIILFGGTYLIYVIEKTSGKETTIDNMANGLYWAMITVTSVGYGDISPETWAGKLITGVFALVGCAFFALPSGILGSGFALQVAKQKKQRRFVKVRNPAAIVIQNCWRNYSVREKNSKLDGTWIYFFPHVIEGKKNMENCQYLPGINEILRNEIWTKFNIQDKQSTNEKPKNRMKDVFTRLSRKNSAANGQEIPLDNMETDMNIYINRRKRHSNSDGASQKKLSKAETSMSNNINKPYKEAIRFILRIRLYHSIKQFKSIRYPFVNVQDIMEKNALCHTETLFHLKAIQDNLKEFREELNTLRREVIYLQQQSISPTSSPTPYAESLHSKMSSNIFEDTRRIDQNADNHGNNDGNQQGKVTSESTS